MLKKVAIHLLSAVAAASCALPASANLDDQWYFGAGYLNATLFPRAEDETITREEDIGQGATLFFGRDFDDRSSGQIQLYSLGETVFTDEMTAEYIAADASLLYRFYDSRDNRIGAKIGTSVYGRFGMGFLDRETDAILSTASGSNVYFGAGAGLETYLTDAFALRGEVTYHDKDAISAHISLVTRFGGRRSRANSPSSARLPTGTPPRASNGSVSGSITASPARNPQAMPIEDIRNGQAPSGNRGSGSSQSPGVPKVAVLGTQSELDDPALDAPRQVRPRPVTPIPVPVNPSATRPPVPAPSPAPTIAQKDSDSDGVPDNADRCQNSPANSPVDRIGCSLFSRIASQIKFQPNSPLPEPNTERALQQLASTMIKYPAISIELLAHTDSKGNAQAESLLTRQRLKAIGIYLLQRGIQRDRLLLRSFGGKRPAFDNNTAEGRRANNRIIIVEKS